MASVPSIDNDTQLRQYVWSITGYDNSPDELDKSDLDNIIDVAKMDLRDETGSSSWYSDRGLGRALLYTVCIKAKGQMENLNVASYQVGNEQVQARDADPETSQLLQEWHDKKQSGLNNSSVVDSDGSVFLNDTQYIG